MLVLCPNVPPDTRRWVIPPMLYGFSRTDYDDIFLPVPTDGCLAHAYWLRLPGPTSARVPTILVLHGNAGIYELLHYFI